MVNLPIQVNVRLVVLSIHDIDTAAEKFTGEFYLQATWNAKHEFGEDFSSFSTAGDGMLPQLSNKWRPKWSPKLQVSQLISETQLDQWFKVEREGFGNEGNAKSEWFIVEMRRFKATFYEKLELYNYPFDIQKLNIELVSAHPVSECQLVRDPYLMSDVLVDNFRDSQEWTLYHYVSVQDMRTVCWDYTEGNYEHSSMNFYCVASRNAQYFVLNAFLLMFLICMLSFNVFSISPTIPASRISAQTTLILTSVSFKWVVNRSLPPIGYLTTLDVYSIGGIFFMSMLDCWHGFVGADFMTEYRAWDKVFLYASAVVFVLLHVGILHWSCVHIFGHRSKYSRLQNHFAEQVKLRKRRALTASYAGSASCIPCIHKVTETVPMPIF